MVSRKVINVENINASFIHKFLPQHQKEASCGSDQYKSKQINQYNP